MVQDLYGSNVVLLPILVQVLAYSRRSKIKYRQERYAEYSLYTRQCTYRERDGDLMLRNMDKEIKGKHLGENGAVRFLYIGRTMLMTADCMR